MTIEVFLDAYGDCRKVGVLRRHSGARRERVTYEHDQDWLTSPEAFQFDPTLPSGAEPCILVPARKCSERWETARRTLGGEG